MNFLSGVQGYNPNQGGAPTGGGFAVLFQNYGLNRLDPTANLGGLPGASPMDPTSQLLGQQQQTMQLMLTTMMGMLLQLMTGAVQGGASNATGGDSASTSPVSDTQGASGSNSGASSSNTAGGSSSSGAPGDKASNAKIVAEVARQKGVDPVTAVACMLVESGGSNAATGDNGTSFGLFQLHRGGELGNMSEQEARDPRRNAEVALSVFAANKGKYSDPGQLAAASQRPADRAGYARKVDAMLPEARRLLGM